MNVNDAIEKLRLWCEQSSGEPIEIAPGRILTFASHAVFGTPELQVVERRLDFRLPDSYRWFMAAVGQAIVFREPRYGSGGMHFFTTQEIVDASLRIWEGEEEVGFDRFCFIGWHRSMGDYFGFVINRAGQRNFDVFCHEYPPGRYVEISNEIQSWRTFDEWIIRAVESYGEDTL